MERAATITSSLEAEQDSEKPSESEGFEQIINFLNAKPIRYTLTVNPIVYASCVKQFWTTTKVKKVNGQEQIQALVDKQKVIITEESIRCDLKFDDAEGTKKIKPKGNQRQAAEVHSPSSEIPIKENIPTPSNDPLPSEEAKISQAKEIAKLRKRVKKLEKKRKSRPAGLRRLKKVGSSKQVESYEEKDSLGAQEDVSKQGRSIKDIDQDAKIALVDKSQGRMHDADMFGVDDLEGNEVFVDVREKTVEKEVSTVDPVTNAGEVVTAASVEDSAAPTTATTVDVDDELHLAKTLIAIKAAKPKVISTAITTRRTKGIVFYEQVRKYFAAKRAKEIRYKPPTKVQQKSLMCTYMKYMEGYKQKDFKGKSFNDIKKIFDKVYKRVNTFVDIDTENVEESLKKTQEEGISKRAGQELEQESAKKQKLAKQEQAQVADDDTAELKR
nr:hypothetical protein [Tanacetum cinerariifolium]